MIRDTAGRPLSPSHASKQGQRYLYYVGNTDAGSAAPSIRLAAPALERAVGDAVREALRAPDILPTDLPARQLAPLQRALATLVDRITSTVPQRHTLAALDLQLEVGDDAISGSICRDRLLTMLDPAIDTLDQGRCALQINTSLRRRGHELRLRIDPPRGQDGRDEKLVATIIRAHHARGLLDTAETLAASTLREMRRLARLSYLAPDIVTAIFEGRQPRMLTTRTLTRIADLPLGWRAQRTLLGFA